MTLTGYPISKLLANLLIITLVAGGYEVSPVNANYSDSPAQECAYVEIELANTENETDPIETVLAEADTIVGESTIPEAILEPDLTSMYFETNKCLYTLYGEDSEWGRRCASPYRKSLISIDEDTKEVEVNGKKIFVHSIATNNKLLPYESIIYIEKLDKYFIVDDNADGSYGSISNVQDYQTQAAWNRGCSIWIDIFCGLSTGYAESGADYNKLASITGITSGMSTLTFKLIRYGKG